MCKLEKITELNTLEANKSESIRIAHTHYWLFVSHFKYKEIGSQIISDIWQYEYDIWIKCFIFMFPAHHLYNLRTMKGNSKMSTSFTSYSIAWSFIKVNIQLSQKKRKSASMKCQKIEYSLKPFIETSGDFSTILPTQKLKADFFEKITGNIEAPITFRFRASEMPQNFWVRSIEKIIHIQLTFPMLWTKGDWCFDFSLGVNSRLLITLIE